MWASIIMAAVGAVAAGISALAEGHQQDLDIQFQRKQNREIEAEKLKTLQDEFDVQKKEQNKAADRLDLQTTINELLVSEDVNNQLDALSNSEALAAQQYNSERMQAGQSEGDALSTVAASGTRSSSMQQAVDLQAAATNAELDLQKKQQNIQNEYQLNNILSGLASNTQSLQSNRDTIWDTRLGYDDGSLYGNGEGGQYKLFSDQYSNIQSAADRADESYKRQQQNLRSNMWWRTIVASLGGAKSGWSLGEDADTAWQSWKSPDYDNIGSSTQISLSWNNSSAIYG